MLKKVARSVLLSTVFATPVMAGVTLTSSDGNISISGELQKYENEKFYIRTNLGDLVIDAANAVCEGVDCPEPPKPDFNYRIASASGIRNEILPSMISAFLQSSGNSAILGKSGDRMVANVVDAQNRILGAVEIGQQNNDAAFAALLKGDVDVIFTDRRANDAEVERFISAGLGNLLDPAHETIFAQDAVVIATSPLNPVGTITMEQAEGVFSGRITNWSQLGGPDRPIEVFLPQEPSALANDFYSAVLEPEFSDYTPKADRSQDLENMSQVIAQSPSAIGIVSSAQLGNARQMVLTRSCGIETLATPFNIRSEDYPLARRIYAYSTSKGKTIKENLSFLTSDAGQEIVDRWGYVSLSPDMSDLNGLGKQLAYSLVSPEASRELKNLRKFTEEVIGATRLSTTFRFAAGSSQLDNKSRADALRLSELLKEPQYEGAEVLLVGFTDSIGKSDVNTLLSQRRAGQVLEEIQAASGAEVDISRFRVMGFGEAYPAACNTDVAGRDLNRRVEVWLR